MKHSFPFLLFSILVGSLPGCSNSARDGSDLSDSKRKKIESDVINRFHAMIKYSEAGELEKVLSFFDPSGPGIYIDGPVRYASLEDLVVNYRATWKVGKQDYGIPDTKMFVLSPVYVLVSSSSTLSTTNNDGTTFDPRAWSMTILWHLKEGEWLIHSFHQFAAEPVPRQEAK